MLTRRQFVALTAGVIASLRSGLASAADSPAAPEDRFAVAGIAQADARALFEALQSALRASDTGAVAALVEYPLRVNSRNAHRFVADRAQFVSEFPSIFTDEVRAQALAQKFNDLFVNYTGVMVGNGAVWFSGVCNLSSPPGSCEGLRVRIISVNLDAPR